MKKWTKRILITLGSLILLLLIAAVAIPYFFKDKIEAMVKEQVNANVNATVDWGEWDITIFHSFPDLTVTVANVKVCNKAPFEGTCLADIGSFSATIDIKSVFGDKIDVKRIALTKPFIHAVVLEDGKANWDIALPDTAKPAADTTASKFHIGMRGFSVTDGHVIYDDASLTMLMDLKGVDLEGSGDMTQDLYTLSTKTHVDSSTVAYGGVKYLKNAVADITADIDMDMPNMKFTFKENEATVNQLVLGFNGWLAMPKDDIDMDITWKTKKNDLATILSLVPAEFASDLKGVDMSGKTAFSGYVKGTYNEKTMPGFGLTIDVDNGRFKYPTLPESVEGIFVDCNITSPQGNDMDGLVIDLKRFAMKLAGQTVEARMHLSTPISDPNVDADLRAQLDLASIKRVVPMPKGDDLKGSFTADVKMAGRMSDVDKGNYDKFKAEGILKLMDMVYKSDSLPYPVGISNLAFAFSPRSLQLTDYTGTIGGSDIKANGRMDNYLQWWLRDSTLAGTFNVASNKFDLNELMGPSEPTAATSPTGGGKGGATPAPADTAQMSLIEVPKNVDFTLNANVKQVLYGEMKLENCKGGLRVHDERVDLRDLFFNLFEGSVTMNGGYDTHDKAHPGIDLAYDVKDLDIQQTVKYMETVQKMAPIARSCKGKFSTDLRMKAELDQHMMPIMTSLTGDGTLRTRSVAIEGFKPLVELSKVIKLKELEKPTLQDVSFSYEFKDGKMITKPFDVKLDRVKATVDGSTAFADQAIDYNMKAKVPSDMFGAAANQFVAGLLGQANAAVGSNFQVPAELDLTAKITGTIDKPIVKPVFGNGGSNAGQAAVEIVKGEANKLIEENKEKAIAEARRQAADLLAQAQKQADDLKAQARKQAADLKAQGYKAADDAVAQVKDPFGKVAAKLAADKAKKEADKKEQQAIAEADKKADAIVEAARKQGDALIAKAEATNTTIK